MIKKDDAISATITMEKYELAIKIRLSDILLISYFAFIDGY